MRMRRLPVLMWRLKQRKRFDGGAQQERRGRGTAGRGQHRG